MFGSSPVLFYCLVVNLYVFILMFFDKHQARKGGWRVPERNILFMCMIGGGMGGFLSGKIFHHKTRKKKFLVSYAIGTILVLCLLYSKNLS